jgi:hypothetical protein
MDNNLFYFYLLYFQVWASASKLMQDINGLWAMTFISFTYIQSTVSIKYILGLLHTKNEAGMLWYIDNILSPEEEYLLCKIRIGFKSICIALFMKRFPIVHVG